MQNESSSYRVELGSVAKEFRCQLKGRQPFGLLVHPNRFKWASLIVVCPASLCNKELYNAI